MPWPELTTLVVADVRSVKPGKSLQTLLAISAKVVIASSSAHAQDGVVRGVVYDSIRYAPIAHAVVQLARAPSELTSPRAWNSTADAQGRFRFDSVAPGRYLATFSHPILDSLGIEAPVQAVTLGSARTSVDLLLSLPSAATLIDTMCPLGARGDSTSLFIGHVRRADTEEGVTGASLLVRWNEIELAKARISQVNRRLTITANAAGRFAICNLPVGLDLVVSAATGADSSGAIELEVPLRGVRWRDFLVGTADRHVVRREGVPSPHASNSATSVNDPNVSARVVWSGQETVRGRVLDSQSRPVVGALVQLLSVAGATRTDENGDFALVDAPSGTRTLLARAIGFAPATQAIDIRAKHSIDGTATRVELRLDRVRSSLDTVRVFGAADTDRDGTGFERRRRKGTGVFITAADIAKQAVVFTTDVLNRLLAIRIKQIDGENVPFMRGAFGECIATVYIDGMRFRPGLGGLDALTWPADIDGIEIYLRSRDVPHMYWADDCGAVLVWTDRRRARTPEPNHP
ncbi:MAG: carboxypeptidase regulatory-like domain-containing protein [Gemmatimonadaceae bacterium]